MCILFVYVNPSPVPGSYKLVIASNRDEVYTRPSKDAHQWESNPDIYGGIDLQPGKEGGTWLAVNKKGRIGILLNIGQNREVHTIDANSGRGFYVGDFISNLHKSPHKVFTSIKQSCNENSSPFKLVTFDFTQDPIGEPKFSVLTYSITSENRFSVDNYQPGVHGLGNNAPNVTWNKVEKGKQQLEEIMQDVSSWADKEKLIQNLTSLLNCKDRHWPDNGIMQQLDQKPAQVLECLSSVFVDIPVANYGTRSQSVILVSNENEVVFYERTLTRKSKDGAETQWKENRFEFQLEL